MPLIDDGSVTRADNDLVAGIYFASADDGFGGKAGTLLAKQ